MGKDLAYEYSLQCSIIDNMQTDNQYYVYIMTNKSGTLYVGLTNNIKKRVYEHKNKLVEGFTKKYNITKLLYFETFCDIYSAIAREKTIKGWLRKKKIDLIKSVNPDWSDLSNDWCK
jgi:putative endonuclease